MEKTIVEQGGNKVAVIKSDEAILGSPQDVLDLIATVSYNDGCTRIALNKEALSEDFFDLSSGFAGEVLQKFVQYGQKLAIIGDFSNPRSTSLRDLIRESNRGNDAFFVGTEEEAIERLAKAK